MFEVKGTNKPSETTLNDIPIGQIFEGEILRLTSSTKGIWMRCVTKTPTDVCAICLTTELKNKSSYPANTPVFHTTCVKVANYRPIKRAVIEILEYE